MLHRQRLILALLNEAGGEASHLETTKWAFLVRMETAHGGGASFYQFVPYQYGPFSFGLFQEVAAMTRDGLVEETSSKRWRLTDAGRNEARRVESAAAAAARSIVRKFAGASSETLIDHVYRGYPWFTINSKIRQEQARPLARPAVFTAGYQGLLIDGFLNGLLKAGIARLIDVRHNPIARRYGFHKSTLGRLCGYLGIDYQHVPELGIPSMNGRIWQRADMRHEMRLFESYAQTTLVTQTAAIMSVVHLVKERASVLVCMEAKPCECHRSTLAGPVAALSGLPTVHLEIAP